MKAAALLLLPLVLNIASAETVRDREGAVRADRARLEADKRWAYNDLESGFRQARLTGRPLLVVMRCVPCMSCMGLDTAVLMEGGQISPLLDQFVCVRVINANAIDLTRFQFDYDLSFSTLFFNADGTVYGRFGSWSHQKNSADQTLAGYKKALESALEIHRGYPANKAALAGKQPGPVEYVNPVDMPKLAERYTRELNWDGKVVQSCVHCHMIGDAMRASYRDRKQTVPDEWVFPMPAPETLGLTLAAEQAIQVMAVVAGGLADLAGVKAGDEVLSLAGQPLISTADFAWVLHRAGESARMELSVRRAGEEKKLSLDLPTGWRKTTDVSGRVGTWSMRGMAAGGLNLVDLTDEERHQRGLGTQGMALWVKGLGMHGLHAAARKAGFEKDDVLVEVAGMTHRLTESRLLGHLMQEHPQGEKVPVKVRRGDQSVDLLLPMQ